MQNIRRKFYSLIIKYFEYESLVRAYISLFCFYFKYSSYQKRLKGRLNIKNLEDSLKNNGQKRLAIFVAFHDPKKISESNFNYLKTLKRSSFEIIYVHNGPLTKNAKIRCTNYNEYDLLTCFANDYGYEKWVEKSLEFYADEGDVLILISASGNSKNMINAANFAKKNKISKIITFTGNDKDNRLSKLGDINFWVNSKSYNLIENTHQALLLSLVDLIIGKLEYPPN